MQSIFKIVMQGPLGEDLTGSPEDLLTRTWTRSCTARTSYIFHQAPLMQSIFKILMQGPTREDFNRTSTRSPHKDRYKIMQGLLRGLHHDLYKVFSQGIVKDFDQDLHARTPKRISQDRHKRTSNGCDKILIQEPPKRPPQELS